MADPQLAASVRCVTRQYSGSEKLPSAGPAPLRFWSSSDHPGHRRPQFEHLPTRQKPDPFDHIAVRSALPGSRSISGPAERVGRSMSDVPLMRPRRYRARVFQGLDFWKAEIQTPEIPSSEEWVMDKRDSFDIDETGEEIAYITLPQACHQD